MTSGLPYSAIVPHIGGIYDSSARIEIDLLNGVMPTKDLIYSLPLDSAANTDELGISVSYVGTQSFQFDSELGRNCCVFAGGSINSTTTDSAFDKTLSIWFKSSSGGLVAFDTNSSNFFGISSAKFYYPSGNTFDYSGGTDNHWHHFALVKSGNTYYGYLDGTFLSSGTGESGSLKVIKICIGGSTYGGNYNDFSGSLAACRIYKRALSNAEIAVLAAEFTPTQA